MAGEFGSLVSHPRQHREDERRRNALVLLNERNEKFVEESQSSNPLSNTSGVEKLEEARSPDVEIARKTMGTGAHENPLINIESLALDAGWQCRRQALREGLGKKQLVGDIRDIRKTLEHVKDALETAVQIGPVSHRFEFAESREKPVVIRGLGFH
jgi:hypothetical protein